jgi:hypothetical protein
MSPQTLEQLRILTDNANPRHLDGWCWLEKAVAMCELIESTKPRTLVEVGIFGGRSMIPQALALKEVGSETRNTSFDFGPGVIFGMDPWLKSASIEGEHKPEDTEWWAKLDHGFVMRKFLNRIDELGLVDICIPIRCSSHAAARLFAEESVDILHIDGNHSELASMRDGALYFPKVRLGGHIWLDDIDWPTNASLVRFLDERCEMVQELAHRPKGHCRLYRKRLH